MNMSKNIPWPQVIFEMQELKDNFKKKKKKVYCGV